MPVIHIYSVKSPCKLKEYKEMSKGLSQIFQTPRESIRFLWHKMPRGSFYNWGIISNTNAPLIQVYFRDRLRISAKRKALIYLSEYVSKLHKCDQKLTLVLFQKIELIFKIKC